MLTLERARQLLRDRGLESEEDFPPARFSLINAARGAPPSIKIGAKQDELKRSLKIVMAIVIGTLIGSLLGGILL